jgi:anti-sigma regulatory factor (Ser/Thr protein kinase)
VISRQQMRGLLVDGGEVVDGVGHLVGRIVQVLLDARTFEPAYVTVSCVLCDAVTVVPLTRARLLDSCLHVPYTLADVCGAPWADGSAGHLDPRQAEELDRYYAGLPDRPPSALDGNGHRSRAASGSPAPAEPGTPPVSRNGHRRVNGTTPGSLPVDAGLDVNAGYRGPEAYPRTPLGPWPPVSTSSAEPPWWRRRQWRWPSDLTAVRPMRLELRSLLDLSGLPEDQLEDLILAAGEAATNAVEHARFPSLPVFDVLGEVGEHWARIVIQDHGRWRPPATGGDGGRGLRMMSLLADATLTVAAGGTTVVLRSRRTSAS